MNDPNEPTSINGTIAGARMTWRHYACWFAASGGAFLDGFSIVVLGVALPLLKISFDMSPSLTGLVGSALVLGGVGGALIGGRAADRFGRKRVLLVDAVTIAVAAGIGATAPNPWILILSEFIMGWGVGQDFPTIASYLSELMPKAARSRMLVAAMALQSIGMIAAGLLSLSFLHGAYAADDVWRILFCARGLTALFFFAARLWLPESPAWLFAKGRTQDALARLKQLIPDFSEIAVSQIPTPVESAAAPAAQGFSCLFSPAFRKATALACVPWVLMDVAAFGVGLFTPVIFGILDLDPASHDPLAVDFQNAQGTTIVDAFLLLGFCVGLWIVPRFGHVLVQAIGFGGMALGMALLLMGATLFDHSRMHDSVIMAGFILFNFSMNAGPRGTTVILASSPFPTTIRATASGFAAAVARLGAAVSVFYIPQLLLGWGLSGVVAGMACVCAAGLVATTVLSGAEKS